MERLLELFAGPYFEHNGRRRPWSRRRNFAGCWMIRASSWVNAEVMVPSVPRAGGIVG
jgi:hypothetical protein